MDLYFAWKTGRSPDPKSASALSDPNWSPCPRLIRWRKQDYHQISSVANKDTVHHHIEILRLLDNCHCFWTIHLGHSHHVEKGQIFSFWSFVKTCSYRESQIQTTWRESVALFCHEHLWNKMCIPNAASSLTRFSPTALWTEPWP